MLFNRDGFRDVNLGNTSSFQISEWRASGLPTEQHQMMKFDLTALPENAVIETASLSLFFDPNNNDVPRFGHYGDVPTDFYLQRVTSEWDEATVTWNNRPSIDTIGQVLVPGHDSITQNYPDIDVTELVRMMHEGENYGFYLQMASSDLFQILKFASSDHINWELHPKLTITYHSSECGTFRITPTTGQDAGAWSGAPDDIQLAGPYLTTSAWTFMGGIRTQKRSFLDFDLSPISVNATISKAELFLYFPTGNPDVNGIHEGNNQIVVNPITEAWQDTLLNWNNQPAIDAEISVVLPPTMEEKSDYLGKDITEIIRAVHGGSSYYGFSLRMEDESPFRISLLASGDHPEPAYHPLLKVCWENATATDDLSAGSNQQNPDVFPNPGAGQFTIDFTRFPGGEISFFVTDVIGRTVVPQTKLEGNTLAPLDISHLSAGAYYLTTFVNGRQYAVNKIILAR